MKFQGQKMRLLEQAPNDGAPGGTGGSGYAPADKSQGQPNSQKGNPPPASAGNSPPEESSPEDFYDQKKGDPKPAGEKTPEQKPNDPPPAEKIEPASGYTKDAPKVDDPPANQPPPAPADAGLGFELKFDGISEAQKTDTVKFIKDYKVPKEIVEAYLAKLKTDNESLVTATKAAELQATKQIQERRASWHKELKEDPTFGGDAFERNVMAVNKLLTTFMPNTKKELTERKGVLPPSLMRDLASIAAKMNETEGLVHGNPTKPASSPAENYEPEDFYK